MGDFDGMIRMRRIKRVGQKAEGMEGSRQIKNSRMLFFLKSAVFLSLLAMAVYALNRTLTPKYRYSSTNPLTETYRGFYRMEQDTIDIIFLGSSQAAAGFNPQDLYNGFGMESYNLGSNHQSLWASYYWLKEALRYQSPRVAVLDCYELFRDCRKDEGGTRLVFDDMRWGMVKWEAVRTVCNLNEELSPESYFLTNIRFHTRWTGLNETDFTWGEFDAVPQLKGFWLYRGKCGYEEYVPLTIQDAEPASFQEEAKVYLDKIVELCRENGIELVLVKTPTLAETLERHNAIAAYAKANGLKFYDFNEKELYEEIGFDYGQDMNDSSENGDRNAHANPSGARKMTWYLGNELLCKCGIYPKRDWQWEASRDFGERVWKDFYLRNETDLRTYLAMLRDPQYTVFIAVKDEASTSLDVGLKGQLQELGLGADWGEGYRKSYYAVLEGNKIAAEEMAGKRLERFGAFCGGRIIYQIVSAGAECGNDCSIKIDGQEQAKRLRGLNIVVYDHVMKGVVDSVCFDTYVPELTASR